MGFSLRPLGRKLWEQVTPQNEAALRNAEANLARSNAAMARPAQYGVLRDQQRQQQAIQNNQPVRFNAPKVYSQVAADTAINTFAGGVKRFGQDVAGTVLSPLTNKYAEQEKERANRLLRPSYENMYRAYGQDPRLGENQAEIEALAADYQLRTDPLTRSGIGVNDNVARKVVAHGTEAALDIATLGKGPAAFKAAQAAKAGKVFEAAKPSIAAAAALGAGSNLAYTAGQDNVKPLDYVASGVMGAGVGAVIPALGAVGGKVSKAAPTITPKAKVKMSSNQLKVKELDNTILRNEQAIKNAPTPTAQERFLKNRDNLIKERAVLNQKGFAKLPDLPGKIGEFGSRNVKKPNPLESLKQEATPATGARSDYSPENLQANRQIRAKNASSITYADKKTINPDELVTVYRAVPGKAKGGLVEGDWVTPNKEQARLFMKQSWAQDDTGAKIVTKKVKASELRYHADDAKGYVDDELLYVPKATQSQPPKSPLTVEKTKPKVALKEKPVVSPQAPSTKRGQVDSSLNNNIESKGVGLGTEVKRAMTDKDQVLLDELRNIEKQTGETGLVDKFMYNSNMQRGSNATANRVLQDSPNLQTAIGGLDKNTYKGFSDYANARTELSTADKMVATSRSKKDLQGIVAQGDAEFSGRFEALNQHYKGLVDTAQEAGLISKETAQLYKKNNNYIRLQRDMGDLVNQGGRGGNAYSLGSTKLSQKRKGSSKQALPAGEVTAEYTQQIYKEAARNKTAAQLTSVLESHGMATKLDDAAAAKNQNVMKVLKDGKTEYYKVSADIKEAVDNINPYHMNVVMQILAAPGRVLRAGVTGLNPVFIARNLVKDQVGSAINSDSIMRTHNPSSFFKGLFNATSDAVGANNNPLYKDFLKHYGDQTSFDLTRNLKDTQDVVERIRGGKAVGIKQGFRSPIRTLENFASITEKSTRFQNYVGEYKKAISKGLSKEAASEKAAMAAWQNSVDFSRAGTWGRAINTVIPYWNPATQGVRQMGRTFTKHPVKSGATATALIGVPLATATAWNLSSPDTADIYANIPEYEKENNLILIPPGTKQNKDGTYDVIKIPLPPGYKDAFMPIRRAMEAYHADKPVEGTKIAQDILQTVGGPVNFQSKGGFVGSFIPQVAKPAVQWATNTDMFSGKKTEPEYVQNATDKDGNPIPNEKKAMPYTSGTARFIGGLTNSSPMKIEKAVKDIGGTVGLNILNTADKIAYKTGKIPEEQIGGQSVKEGFKRSFGQAQGIENANKSAGGKYYDTLTRLQGEVKLTQAEKNAWDALHPGKKNFLGDTVYENDATYNPAARLDTYNRFPKTFELDKRMDAENRKSGKPGNPLYDLQSWQVKKVLEKENLPPGAKDPELSNLYSKDWYSDYTTQKSKFFSALKEAATKEGRSFGDNSNPYPDTPKDLQKIMDYYSSLPKGTGARSSWIKSNPGQWKRMQDQFANIDNWQNIARGERGLDATEGDTGVAAGYGDQSGSSGGYGSGGRGGSKKAKIEVPNLSKYTVDVGGSAPKAKLSYKKQSHKSKVAAVGGKPKVTIKKSMV